MEAMLRRIVWVPFAVALSSCSPAPDDTCFNGDPKLVEIQRQIFDRSCNKFSSCHNSQAGSSVGSLNLCGMSSPSDYCEATTEGVYGRLVGVFAECTISSGDTVDESCIVGTTFRVQPDRPEESYIYRRLAGIGLTEGVRRMPWNNDPLCNDAINAVRDWIQAGAEPCGPDEGC